MNIETTHAAQRANDIRTY